VLTAALLLLLTAPVDTAPVLPLEHFTVTVEGEPLALWARRPNAPRGTILLIHGRTWSALPDFDLQVPGESHSVLEALARRGYAAYAVDLRGYGGSPRDRSGWLTPKRAAEDVAEVLRWMAASQPMNDKPVLLGWSNGALVAQLAAQTHPDLVSALILYGYPADPDTRIPSGLDPRTPLRQRTRTSDVTDDFIVPGVTSPRMLRAYIAAALKTDPIRTDWRSADQFNQLDATRLRMPTLLLQGEFDPLPGSALARLFALVGSARKQRVTLRGGDHMALLEDTRPTFIDAITGFLAQQR
jgi:pimeloyl-ACP methyl ester carboxylesterase